jgi:hypothetical protein
MGIGTGSGTSERRIKAMSEIETARDAIVEVAAKLTAAGVDTSGLADPVARIGEALTQLVALDREEAARRAARVESAREQIPRS